MRRLFRGWYVGFITCYLNLRAENYPAQGERVKVDFSTPAS
jgi:hypothetical protein